MKEFTLAELEKLWSHWATKKRNLLARIEKIDETLELLEATIDSAKGVSTKALYKSQKSSMSDEESKKL